MKLCCRTVLAVVAICGSSIIAADQSAPRPPKLRWLGQSFFVLETAQGTRIAFDPHAIDAFGRQTVKADVVLMSHPHPDHVRLEVIENRQQAKIIEGVKTAAAPAEGGPPARSQWNPVDMTFKEVQIRSVGVYHDTAQGLQRGKNAIFILEFDGMRLAHLGDLGHLLTEEQLRSIGAVDVLLIPVGGVYTLNGDQAKKVVAQIKPTKYILPMHYGTNTFDDLLPADEFLDGQPNVRKMPKTNELTLDPAFRPDKPVIVVLGWKND
jgi:L-ascorbate metabolism protein UlaG (beta-lactamase superfamily)